MKTISAREAIQAFSKLAAAGEERKAAARRMTRRMRRGVRLGGIKVPRDQLYER